MDEFNSAYAYVAAFVGAVGLALLAGQLALARTLGSRWRLREQEGADRLLAAQADHADRLLAATDRRLAALARALEAQADQTAWLCDAVDELRDRGSRPLYASAGGSKLHEDPGCVAPENRVEIRVDPAGHEFLRGSAALACSRCRAAAE